MLLNLAGEIKGDNGLKLSANHHADDDDDDDGRPRKRAISPILWDRRDEPAQPDESGNLNYCFHYICYFLHSFKFFVIN